MENAGAIDGAVDEEYNKGFGFDSETLARKSYEKLTKILIEQNLSITTMESCTAGQIISLITDTEGSSAVVKGACVTYSNEAKIMAGVPAEIIEKYGVYSKETAKSMAQTCRRKFDSDIGIGVTGTFGNVDPANGDSVPGQVYFAIDLNGDVDVYDIILEPQSSRFAYKMAVAKKIVDVLLEKVENVLSNG